MVNAILKDLLAIVRSYSTRFQEFKPFVDKYQVDLEPFDEHVKKCIELVDEYEKEVEMLKATKSRKRKTLNHIEDDFYDKLETLHAMVAMKLIAQRNPMLA